MRKLILVAVVIYAVTGEGWAQNRGSARYVPPEDFEGDITRAPRPSPTRGSRRHRPTAAEEAAAVDEVKSFQPDTSIRAGTTARRVPQRGRTQQIAPAPPPLPLDSVPLHASVEELPQSPQVEPESRPQNKRRRRPKKRRKPEASSIAEEPSKDGLGIPELVGNDRKRTDEFQSNPQLRNVPSDFGSDPNFQSEKASWGTHGNSPVEQPQSNPAGSQYFKPQQASNRLPVEEPEPIDNTGRYIQPSLDDSNAGDAGSYAPKTYPVGVSNEASYVPVLNPVRVPSEGSSRLPPENYPGIRNQESTRQTLPHEHNTPPRPHSNTFSAPDPNEIILNTGAKPIQNVIVQPNESIIPVRGNSEVRLPPVEPPLLSLEYDAPNFDSVEDTGAPLQPNPKTTDAEDKPASPSNRLPNPSEVHYDSVYPEFSDSHQGDSRRFAGRRQESAERNLPQSYTSPRRNSGTKPHEYDNDAEVDRRQASQYQPPLQRAGSRYKPDEADGSSRSRVPQDIPSTSVPRSRGTSRYQTPESTAERTRGSSRHGSETPSDSSSRLRGSQASSTRESSPRAREPQRYVPDTTDDVPRQSTRRQPSSTQPLHRDTDYGRPASSYVPIEEILNAEQRTPENPARAVRQPAENSRNANEADEYVPARHSLRSRPQYDVRDAGPTHSYEESAEDTYAYDPDYTPPREPSTRSRTNQRTPVLREQPPPQPEYHAPQNRQPNRQQAQYETPQNSRSRHQSQYQAPQNPRVDARHAGSRQQEPESRSRSSAGASRFKCPEPYGFFPDPVQCDKYYECRNGTAEMSLCSDGLAFNEISSPKFLRCDSLRDVDCKSRPELQEPQPTHNCPRRFGLFAHETDCTKFWNCVDGAATEVQCPPGLTYNDERATCDWADLVETSCKSEDLLGFKCPEPTSHELVEGVYSKYPHPTNCQKHFICIKGSDGLRRPRMLSCNEGLVYNPSTTTCTIPNDVPGCEDFYGGRSEPPRKKPPPRQLAPVEPEEESVEEPTPRPRRRGSSRRSRN